MRHTKLVLSAMAVMVMLLVAFAAPAMAKGGNNNNNDTHLDRQDVRLDKQIANNNNFNNDFEFNNFNDDFDFNDDFNDGFFVTPFFANDFEFNNSCPFWGDTEGIVNQWDCFN